MAVGKELSEGRMERRAPPGLLSAPDWHSTRWHNFQCHWEVISEMEGYGANTMETTLRAPATPLTCLANARE